ncbi:SCO family protein [Tenacibaculum sp. 190524A05c]|uniref:SCO family protein n=1 Tax=Tenacibaculum platacis TaxID=3137852 RepID=UPI0032B1C8C7
MKKLNNTLVVFLSSTFFFFSCKKKEEVDKTITLPFFNSALMTPEWIAQDTEEYRKIHKVAKFQLTNQEGKLITNKAYNGKIYVADFFFVTCPGICPVLEKNMSILQEKYMKDDEVFLLSHTVMPTKDSVPVLKQYAVENDIHSEKWNLVTGDKKELYDLARTSYFADEDFVKTQDEDAFIHTENFVLVDKQGRIRGVYNGTIKLEIQRLIRHIDMLKKEG